MSINRVNISGNLTRDPELRSTQAGTQILTFGVAVNDHRRNPQSGEWEEHPNFIDCVVFGARAEPLSRFLTKGSKVAIEGKLRWSQWERDGQKRSKIEVIVDEVEFLSSRQGQGGGYQGQNQGGYQNYGGYQGQGGYDRPAPQQPNFAAPQQQAPAPQPEPQPAYAPQQSSVPAPPPTDVYDEDIPF
jgi:single-strand DNA-binding protein